MMTNGEYQTDRLTNITCDEISGHIAASVPGQTSVGDHQREVESEKEGGGCWCHHHHQTTGPSSAGTESQLTQNSVALYSSTALQLYTLPPPLTQASPCSHSLPPVVKLSRVGGGGCHHYPRSAHCYRSPVTTSPHHLMQQA